MTQPRKHRHAEMIRRWLDDDSLEVEWLTSLGKWESEPDPDWDEGTELRFRPKMITVGKHSFPHPMRVAPKPGGWIDELRSYLDTAMQHNTELMVENNDLKAKLAALQTQEVAAKYIGTCADGDMIQTYVDLKNGTDLFLAAGAAPGQPTAASTPLKYNPAPVYTSNCLRHPAAPHGVDVDASWRAGKTVCVCQSWTPNTISEQTQ